MSPTAWILAAAVGCYALKLGGQLIPPRLLQSRRTEGIVELVPPALLGALIASQTLVSGRSLVVDARLGALGVAVVLVALRAPFLVVVLGAAATASLLRLPQ